MTIYNIMVVISSECDLGSSESVPQGHVGGEGEDGDEDWSGGPEVHTQSIQVLPTLQTLQFCSSA